jgi:hypothetical protein
MRSVGEANKLSNSKSEKATDIILHTPANLSVNRDLQIEVNAVNRKGVLDVSRNDIIKISHNGKQIKLDKSTINLVDGKGKFVLHSKIAQIIRLDADWVDGPSQLKDFKCILKIGELKDLGRAP